MTGQAIAVIFARGTGDAIPLFSARLLGGKPILHYAIRAAQESAHVAKVYVSTEDERIAVVAAEAGAEVIMRPDNLSGEQTPIVEAVSHAAKALKGPLSEVGGHLLAMPADAVFCDTAVIDRAMETYLQGGHDRLVALLPENKKYIIWRRLGQGGLEPVVQPPNFRPDSESIFSEPGVLTVWQVEGTELPSPAQRMGYITVNEKAAFRVDTEYDFLLAERLIAPLHLALRCDGSRKMGMGHITRLLSIAENLRREDPSGWVVRFFVGSEHLEGAQTVTQRGFDVDIVRQDDYAHWAKRMEAFNPRVIVNDLPFVPAQYTEQLCHLPANSLTLVDSVADIEPGSAQLDAVVSLLDEELSWPHREYHHGPDFAPFHPSVIARLNGRGSKRTRPDNLRILVAFGTGDPAGLTKAALSAIVETQRHWASVTIVVQPDQQDNEFRTLAANLKCPLEVVDSPTDRMGELFDQADLALVSGGVTAYEVSALGVPSIVMCQNQRELSRMEQFERIGSILLLGMGTHVTSGQLVRSLERMATDVRLWERMSSSGRQITDGRGVERISEIVRELFSRQGAPTG